MSNRANKILRLDDVEECIILERLNRFIVKISLNGAIMRAYICNTGRLPDYIVMGRRGFCIRHERILKSDRRLFAVEDGDSAAIIDTHLQMQALERLIASKMISWIRSCRILKRNIRLKNSLIDYLLDCNGENVYLEVKSAVLRRGGYAMYPDCPSQRGRRHIREITEHVKSGGRGIILFIAAMPNVEAFKPNISVDPEMDRLLKEADRTGVVIKAIQMHYDPRSRFICLLNDDLRVENLM